MNTEERKQKITELIEDIEFENIKLMNEFFNLLFWKDYSKGHINIEDKVIIWKEINNAKTNKEFIGLDTKKILPFVNKIRKQIGLKELTNELYNGTLLEITDEVRKELILKKL